MPLPDRSKTLTSGTSRSISRLQKDGASSSGMQTPVIPRDAKPEGPIGIDEATSIAWLYHAQTVLEALDVNKERGLSNAQVEERKSQYGANSIDSGDEVSWVKILVAQVANAMSLILILAMAVSFGIRAYIEGGVLAGLIVINVVVGFVQEYSAEKTMSSLRNLASPTARVIRAGEAKTVPANEVAVGDLVEVKMGDTVPADLRLVEAMNFETDEALLTGESLPVAKDSTLAFADRGQAAADVGVGDRINMAYTSSNVTKGRALGVAVGIGMNTEIGRIAEALRGAARKQKIRAVKRNAQGKAGPHRYLEAGALTVWDQVAAFLGLNKGTPLQRKLSWLALYLLFVAILFAIVCFLANLNNDAGSTWSNQEVGIYAVATGVSMIPASLMAVLAITLSVGARQMTKRNVIVRKSEALEALGGVTDICSDKTGTLTQGKMVVRRAWVTASGTFTVSETNQPFNPTEGEVARSDDEPSKSGPNAGEKMGTKVTDDQAGSANIQDDACFTDFLNIAALCNTATVFKDQDKGEWQAHGDPTECALQTFSSRFGFSRQNLTRSTLPDDSEEKKSMAVWKQLTEYPFDSTVKRMAVTYHDRGSKRKLAFMKGAVERVLDACTHVQATRDERVELDEAWRQRILDFMESLASSGLRVLALAMRELSEDEAAKGSELPRERVEARQCFVGLAGIYDPPRPESAGAVAVCKEAGIRVHMLTGDHPGTARAIAASVGILPPEQEMGRMSKATTQTMVMTASQFDKLSEAQIDAMPALPLVIARCSPATKVRMIEALHRRGLFAAMTGDGVNDSPSLKLADVGVGMGTGSDVAKDAADIVLLDDNFASICAAVEEGRRINDNIRRFVILLLAQNVAQAIVLLIGLAFKDDQRLSVFPISPIEAIYVVMLASGIPSMALGFQQAQADVLRRPPYSQIFDLECLWDVVSLGVWTGALCLTAFVLVIYGFGTRTLGTECNVDINTCDEVFRARGAVFTCLCWFSLLLALELTDFRRTVFNKGREGKSSRWTSWATTLWQNKPLFASFFLAIALAFPILYIPVINDQVFLHTGLQWEWGIVFVETLVYLVGVEALKYAKRVFLRHRHRKNDDGAVGGVVDEEKTASKTPEA